MWKGNVGSLGNKLFVPSSLSCSGNKGTLYDLLFLSEYSVMITDVSCAAFYKYRVLTKVICMFFRRILWWIGRWATAKAVHSSWVCFSCR